jgi:hypothetical protein
MDGTIGLICLVLEILTIRAYLTSRFNSPNMPHESYEPESWMTKYKLCALHWGRLKEKIDIMDYIFTMGPYQSSEIHLI